jgi:hypothetical protein
MDTNQMSIDRRIFGQQDFHDRPILSLEGKNARFQNLQNVTLFRILLTTPSQLSTQAAIRDKGFREMENWVP